MTPSDPDRAHPSPTANAPPPAAEELAQLAAQARRRSPQADLRQSLGWIGFGVVVFVLSWRMDRLAHQGVNPYTVPGLLPGCLGIAVVFFGLLMLIRSWRALASAESLPREGSSIERAEARRIWIVLTLCIGYAGALLGHGLPFWLATALFVAASIGVLQFAQRGAEGQHSRGFVFALAMGLATGVLTQLVFQELFLVRLP